MLTYRTRPAQPFNSAGYTLVELLAVLAILAIVAGALVFGSGHSAETARFRAFLVTVSAALTKARTKAVKGAKQVVFQIDTQNRRLGDIEAGQTIEIPPRVELTALVAEGEVRGDGSVGIRFYPAGGSSGGTLSFTYRGLIYEVRVNWLTGNVSTDRV